MWRVHGGVVAHRFVAASSLAFVVVLVHILLFVLLSFTLGNWSAVVQDCVSCTHTLDHFLLGVLCAYCIRTKCVLFCICR